MNYIIGESVQEAWVALLKALSYSPERHVAPRGQGTREIIGLRFEVKNLRNNIIVHPVRNINFKFMVAEALWMAFGLDSVEVLARYNSVMKNFSDDGKTLTGAYGPRLVTQWQYVVESLQKDRNTRQAIATIWTPSPKRSKDIPCTISLQFLLREAKLHVIVTMRSSDAWLGIPYDAFSFSFLTNCLAGVLGIETGRLIMNFGSSHLYDENAGKVEEILRYDDAPYGHIYKGISSPKLPGWPDAWLQKILINPNISLISVLDPAEGVVPNDLTWAHYANVLKSATFLQAREILEHASKL